MQRLLRRLQRRGINLNELDALELFGGTGAFHTLDYAHRVRSLEVWEIDPALEDRLRHNLPRAKIRTVDSYSAAKSASKRYGLIVVDNPAATHGGHIEHFDLFPHIFELAAPAAVLILNVIPSISPAAIARFPDLGQAAREQARRAFYHTETPGNISLEHMVLAYRTLAEAQGVRVEWWECVRRHAVHYLALHVTRQ